MASVYLRNAFNGTVWVEMNGNKFSLKNCECQCVRVNEQGFDLKITHDMGIGDINEEIDRSMQDANKKEKFFLKFGKKAANFAADVALCVNCTYHVTNFKDSEEIIIDVDDFEIGNGFWGSMFELDTMICYPKLICPSATATLTNAKAENKKQFIKKMRMLSFIVDAFFAVLFFSICEIYFRHICKPSILKKHILNSQKYKMRHGKKISKALGCLTLILLFIVALIGTVMIDFAFDVIFIDNARPALVASDYSQITYHDDVYVRISELPEGAYAEEFLSAEIWEDARTDGLTRLGQATQSMKVQLFEDENGNKYLWLVEDYFETILAAEDDGSDKDYWDFSEHYVYELKSE